MSDVKQIQVAGLAGNDTISFSDPVPDFTNLQSMRVDGGDGNDTFNAQTVPAAESLTMAAWRRYVARSEYAEYLEHCRRKRRQFEWHVDIR